MTTPRPERVLRYHFRQVAQALIASGAIVPADPASGSWWRLNREATRVLNAAAELPCPDCDAPAGRQCYPECLRFRDV